MKRRWFLSLLGGTGFIGYSMGASGSGNQSPSSSDWDTQSSSSNSYHNEYHQLQEDYQELKSRYTSLENRFEQCRDDYLEVQKKTRNAAFPPYVIAEDRSFMIATNTLDGETNFYEVDSETLEAQLQFGNYMRELTVSNMRNLRFQEIYSRFEGGTKYRRIGNFGRVYQLNPFVVASNFPTIAEDIYNRHTMDYDRVRGVWNFVTQLNAYSYEIQETPRMPLETLLLGGGDCEDTTILAASILAAMSTDWRVQFVYMDADNPDDPQEINHTVPFVKMDDGQLFIETTSNSVFTPYEEVSGFFFDVSPHPIE